MLREARGTGERVEGHGIAGVLTVMMTQPPDGTATLRCTPGASRMTSTEPLRCTTWITSSPSLRLKPHIRGSPVSVKA